jgi:G:T-mismatch repair DNA endonuclease (very short patch repair protein)
MSVKLYTPLYAGDEIDIIMLKTLGATIKNVVVRATRQAGFVHLCLITHYYCPCYVQGLVTGACEYFSSYLAENVARVRYSDESVNAT